MAQQRNHGGRVECCGGALSVFSDDFDDVLTPHKEPKVPEADLTYVHMSPFRWASSSFGASHVTTSSVISLTNGRSDVCESDDTESCDGDRRWTKCCISSRALN